MREAAVEAAFGAEDSRGRRLRCAEVTVDMSPLTKQPETRLRRRVVGGTPRGGDDAEADEPAAACDADDRGRSQRRRPSRARRALYLRARCKPRGGEEGQEAAVDNSDSGAKASTAARGGRSRRSSTSTSRTRRTNGAFK